MTPSYQARLDAFNDDAWRARERARSALPTIKRGDLVRVGPAYVGGQRFRPDGTEGVYTVLDVRAQNLGLARGDVRAAMPGAGEYDVFVYVGRCEAI